MTTLTDYKTKGLQSRRRYLNGNDWKSSRLTRTTAANNAVDIPAEDLTQMQKAADEINLIESATTLNEVEHLTINF